jgi:hypothetical protein
MFNILILSIIALIALYFGMKYGGVPYIKELRYRASVEGTYERLIKEAEQRRDVAKDKLGGLDYTDPNYVRWQKLLERAESDIRGHRAALKEREIRQEEERMISGE